MRKYFILNVIYFFESYSDFEKESSNFPYLSNQTLYICIYLFPHSFLTVFLVRFKMYENFRKFSFTFSHSLFPFFRRGSIMKYAKLTGLNVPIPTFLDKTTIPNLQIHLHFPSSASVPFFLSRLCNISLGVLSSCVSIQQTLFEKITSLPHTHTRFLFFYAW